MSANTAPRRAIILGALSAVGEATCRLLAVEGAHLALFARNAERLETVAGDLRARGAGSVVCYARDLGDTKAVESDLRAASNAIGGADAVLIFYGVLGDQQKSETNLEAARAIIAANFTSAADWALASANLLMQAQGPNGPVLLGVSSVAGDRGRRSNYIYGAAKGALSLLLQGIGHRFAATPDGPHAVTVKAGFIDSPMTAGYKKGPLWASPDGIARSIRRAMEDDATIVYAPWFWRWIMLIIRMLPEAIFNKINL